MVPGANANPRAMFTRDAAVVLGIASTAMPFARSSESQAERWLRVLRAHGEAGVVLKSLGVSEATVRDVESEDAGRAPDPDVSERGDVVADVTERAAEIARGRGAPTVGTLDVLVAAMQVYGVAFDRVLEAHGTSRWAVMVKLSAELEI